MIDDDQALLTNLYGRCCAPAGSYNAWKALSVRYANATGNPVRTDFCSFPGQICTPSGLSAAQSGDDRHLPHSVVLDTGSTLSEVPVYKGLPFTLLRKMQMRLCSLAS